MNSTETLANWRALLGRTKLFAGFEAGELDRFLAQARERKMRRGEVLLRAGDPGDSMMAILLGEVRIMLADAQGRDQIINTLGVGAVFGEMALFDGRPRSADVVAATNGRLLVIERGPVQALLASDPRFAARVIEILCGRLRDTLVQLDAMLFQDVATRLATSLLGFAHGARPRRVDMTQAALGQAVGASREIVNKRLRAWEAAGIVGLSPGRVLLLDEAALFSRGAGPGASAGARST
jgi:CRP-like cAMP-binding protein